MQAELVDVGDVGDVVGTFATPDWWRSSILFLPSVWWMFQYFCYVLFYQEVSYANSKGLTREFLLAFWIRHWPERGSRRCWCMGKPQENSDPGLLAWSSSFCFIWHLANAIPNGGYHADSFAMWPESFTAAWKHGTGIVADLQWLALFFLWSWCNSWGDVTLPQRARDLKFDLMTMVISVILAWVAFHSFDTFIQYKKKGKGCISSPRRLTRLWHFQCFGSREIPQRHAKKHRTNTKKTQIFQDVWMIGSHPQHGVKYPNRKSCPAWIS